MLAKDFLYLDYVSTTPLNKEVFNMYNELLSKYYANSDSLHDLGTEVRKLQEKSRHQIADLLKVKNDEVIFTGGASEANNTAIKGVAFARKELGKHIITSAVEHSSVMESCVQLSEHFGYDVTFLPVNKDGQITLEDVKKALRDDTILVTTMYVNNELGSINPIMEIADYLKKNSQAYYHVDAVQALGKLPIELTNIDLLSLSMHKIFGLKGSGILIKKQHVAMLPLISAGQQERGYRGGTSNACVNIIAAKTLRLALMERVAHYQYVDNLRRDLLQQLSTINGIIINSPVNGSPFIINFSYPKITSEVMMNALNKAGIAVSAQSTCHSNTKAISHVYQAMGYDDQRSHSAIRIGLDYMVTMLDIDRFMIEIKRIIKQYG